MGREGIVQKFLREEGLDEETKEEDNEGIPEQTGEVPEEEVKEEIIITTVMKISVTAGGSLQVEMKGPWTAKHIRAIPVATIKAYRRAKIANKIKEEANNG